jgi:hypothetical protein
LKLGNDLTVEEMQLQELNGAIQQETLQLKTRKALRGAANIIFSTLYSANLMDTNYQFTAQNH